MDQFFLETPLGFSVEITGIIAIINSSPVIWFFALFAIGLWIVVALKLFKLAAEKLVEYRQELKQHWKWTLLAVDIPALFIQSPKAVEQIFTQLSGALASINIIEKYWYGKKQKTFSFEIISIEGYTQFLVRTEMEFRDLVEAAVYAQYPEAEITEVEDYTSNLPEHLPHPDYDVFGVEFKLAEEDPYPIRTYEHFEHNISKDQIFSDPMASILENFSRIGRGENLWMQIIVQPINNQWKEKGIDLVKTIVENKHHESETPFIVKAIAFPFQMLGHLVQQATTSGDSSGGHKKDDHKKEEKPKGLGDLTPGKRATVEAIEEKISKIGFKSKIQVLYVARKENFFPSRCIDGLIGAMNQFHVIGRNAIVPSLVTAAPYDKHGHKTAHLKSAFVERYRKRKIKGKHKHKGGHGHGHKDSGHASHHPAEPYILNIEELATIWHFPLPNVRTPLIQKAGAKRAEPPPGLPTELVEGPLRKKNTFAGPPPTPVASPPEPPSKPPVMYA